MLIKLGEGVSLSVDITDQMQADRADCIAHAKVPEGEGKNCEGCSLDVDVFGFGLCELPAVVSEIEKKEGSI